MASARIGKEQLVEFLLYRQHPGLRIAESLATVMPKDSQSAASARRQLEEARAALAARPEHELLSMYEQARASDAAYARARAAKKEASLFFNRPEAQADFSHWAKLDYWTQEESVALLLGKNPERVDWKTVEKELFTPFTLLGAERRKNPHPFHVQFENLRKIVLRAEVFETGRARPRDVLEWVRRSRVVDAPPDLVAALARASTSGDAHAPAPAPAPVPATAEPAPQERSGRGQVWDQAAREELRAFRSQHGTKAAAERFNISESRVRQLLPGEKPKPQGCWRRPKFDPLLRVVPIQI